MNKESSMRRSTSSVQTSYFGKTSKFVVLGVMVALGITIYSQWPEFVLTSVEWQKTLHAMLASHISAVSNDAIKYGSALIALSFFYGVFHAVGPGHGKAVIVTYLGTNKENMKKGIFISLAAAILQSIVAIVLVSALARLLQFKLSEVHNYGNDMTLVSYILVIFLGAMLIVTSISRLIKLRLSQKQKKASKITHKPDHTKSHTHNNPDHHSYHNHSHDHHEHSNDHDHTHGSNCGCSHAHAPKQNQSALQTLTVILSMGFRPCSGAILVLIFAHLIGVYYYGVVATLMMGIGTGITVSFIAIGTMYARSWLERFASESGRISIFTRYSVSTYIRLIGGTILVFLGWSFFNAASVITSAHPLFQ